MALEILLNPIPEVTPQFRMVDSHPRDIFVESPEIGFSHYWFGNHNCDRINL